MSKMIGLGAMLLMVLSGCALPQKFETLHEVAKPDVREASHGYDQITQDFEAGKVMEAYAGVVAMPSSHADYMKTQKFLEQKINPARIRLLRHYKAQAKNAEKNEDWAQALSFYQQTAEFSAQPEVFDVNIQEMALKARQVRLSALLKERRLEDALWLQGLEAYSVPKGVAQDDRAFAEFLRKHKQQLRDRVQDAYVDALKYMNRDMLDIAYVLLESNVRLDPDFSNSSELMRNIQATWPKGLVIPQENVVEAKAAEKRVVVKRVKRVKEVVRVVKRQDVVSLMEQGDWLKARDVALEYQQRHGEDADQLLQDIDAKLKVDADVAFQQGRLAFRQEHIDQAVSFWDQAVTLQPDNNEYVDALRRAMQLKERLDLLRSSEQ